MILLHHLFVAKDVEAAEKAIRKLAGVKRYRSSLRSAVKKDRFVKHLRRYIHMYRTDCAWEVSTTNRYTITSYEAAVTARQRIKQGETIKYLTGTLVPLTAEESASLDLTQRNFSIVSSSRKKASSIFLGPARFANHDCGANARLVTKGGDSMEIIAMKNIDIGEEITVSYGDDYFGPANIDCLCHSCEKAERNGWTPRSTFTPRRSNASPMPHSALSARSTGRKRMRESTTSLTPVSKKRKTSNSPSKLQHAWTPPETSDSETTHDPETTAPEAPASFLSEISQSSPLKATISDDSPRQDSPHNSSDYPEEEQQRAFEIFSKLAEESGLYKGEVPIARRSIADPKPTHKANKPLRMEKMTARLLGALPTPSSTPTSETSTSTLHEESVEGGLGSSITTSVEQSTDIITIKVETVENAKLETDSDAPNIHHEVMDNETEPPMSDLVPEQSTPQALSTITTTTVSKISSATESGSDFTVLPSVEEVSITKMTIQPIPDSVRVSGDWFLTRKLLAQPHDRWIYCRNARCGGFFVQPNGYQTRRECPRCERHSMLYGFPWPKTDPDPRMILQRKKGKDEKSAYRRHGKQGKGTWVEGAGDEECRTLDHRTIHRFVYPDEERETTRKGLLEEAERVRDAGGDPSALLLRRGFAANGVNLGGGTDSMGRESFDTGSLTPDDGSGVRRSGRFVQQRVYAVV